jgi:hypothetical protein
MLLATLDQPRLPRCSTVFHESLQLILSLQCLNEEAIPGATNQHSAKIQAMCENHRA